MPNPRGVALQVLLKIEEDKAYSNLALANAIRGNRLSGVDSAFVSALVYGVLERQLTLDYIIKQYSKIPLRKIEIKTKLILRMGVLQLLCCDLVDHVLRGIDRYMGNRVDAKVVFTRRTHTEQKAEYNQKSGQDHQEASAL